MNHRSGLQKRQVGQGTEIGGTVLAQELTPNKCLLLQTNMRNPQLGTITLRPQQCPGQIVAGGDDNDEELSLLSRAHFSRTAVHCELET